MPNTNDPLSLKVEQFKHDVDIVHQITHGDDTVVVQTEGGPVRSLAKLIHDAQASLTNLKFFLKTSNPLTVQDGMFTLQTQALGDVVLNMAMVFLDLTSSDFKPDGSLKYDRDYDIEEHIGIVVSEDGFTGMIPGQTDYLNGKYAQVTYLTCVL